MLFVGARISTGSATQLKGKNALANTYVVLPFDLVHAGMGSHDAVEVDVGALADRVRIERAAEPDLGVGNIWNYKERERERE